MCGDGRVRVVTTLKRRERVGSARRWPDSFSSVVFKFRFLGAQVKAFTVSTLTQAKLSWVTACPTHTNTIGGGATAHMPQSHQRRPRSHWSLPHDELREGALRRDAAARRGRRRRRGARRLGAALDLLQEKLTGGGEDTGYLGGRGGRVASRARAWLQKWQTALPSYMYAGLCGRAMRREQRGGGSGRCGGRVREVAKGGAGRGRHRVTRREGR